VRFFRRRTLWIPTVWTWLLLLAVCAGAVFFALRHVYGFLAVTRPVGARLLVVEGWMPADELDQSLAVFAKGRYERVLTTGGPIERDCDAPEAATYAERARKYLVRAGLAPDTVIALPSPSSAQERTFLNGVMVREWLTHSGVALDALDVFSSGVHSRRSQVEYGWALGPKVKVGVWSAEPSGYDRDAWWRTSYGAKEVLGEAISWLWIELWFRPGPPGSVQEKWAVPG
jgi:hypothetical protein